MRVSYSKWSLYHMCPYKYNCVYNLGLKEVKDDTGSAMARGSIIHDMLENNILGNSTALPWDAGNTLKVPPMGIAHPMQETMYRLKSAPIVNAELSIELDINMKPVPEGTDAAFIVIFDAIARHDNRIEVFEWKSGKAWAEHAEQRHLYAAAALNIWNPEEVVVTTHYVDITSPPIETRVTKADAENMRVIWVNRRETMITDEILAPRPNSKCRFCHLSRDRGGPCVM